MAETRIDVSIEQKQMPQGGRKRHPNTCPSCGSHYRDDELERELYVCAQCGHHFPVRARKRIEQLADRESFLEEGYSDPHLEARRQASVHFWAALKDPSKARDQRSVANHAAS